MFDCLVSKKKECELTLKGPNYFFRRFSGHNQALFVNRLIDATIIVNFFDDPFLK